LAAADRGRVVAYEEIWQATAMTRWPQTKENPMRNVIIAAVVLLTANVGKADDTPKASGTLDGKHVKFPKTSIAGGVKAAVGLLESCHDHSLYQADELEKALQTDHIRVVFSKPVMARVCNEQIEFSELVFRLPMNTGVFWVRTGDKWRRYSKYELEKEKPFTTWLREAERAPIAAEPIGADNLAQILELIKPKPGGTTWLQIPWQTHLAEARKQAAAEGKPILLWEMDGNPLGCG
jgi:hypothetical protein